MLDFVKNKILKNNKYKDISVLYEILKISDNYVLIQKEGDLNRLYIYKVQPVTILNSNKNTNENILTVYTEFLRSMDIDFQIYLENAKININEYFNNIFLTDKNKNKEKLANVYKKELECFLNKNSIYIFNYYIIISLNNRINFEEVNKNIYNLENMGVVLERLEGEDILNNFIYSKINQLGPIC